MKTYYLTLSKVFPSTHAKAGMNTCFEEKLRVYKLHTIRANDDFWKKRFEQIAAGKACLSIRQWVGKPYGKGSTQREIVRLTREDGIGLQELRIVNENYKGRGIMLGYVDGEQKKDFFHTLSQNDGLSFNDWLEWFKGYNFTVGNYPFYIIQILI